MRPSYGDLEIRAPRAGDIAVVTALVNLPGVRFGTLRLPFTREDAVNGRFIAPDPWTHPIVGLLSGEVVAHAALIAGRGRRAHSGELLVSVHDAHVGHGVGRRMMAALIDLADNWLGLTRLELSVHVDNAPALALYTSLGFEREGLQRAADLRDGVLVDAYPMARLREPPRRAVSPA